MGPGVCAARERGERPAGRGGWGGAFVGEGGGCPQEGASPDLPGAAGLWWGALAGIRKVPGPKSEPKLQPPLVFRPGRHVCFCRISTGYSTYGVDCRELAV